MKRFFLLFLCFYATIISAQSPGDLFNPHSFNKKYLEHLIKEGVDSVRISHRLKPLANDSILYVASDHHSKWMLENKKLGHFESEKKTKDPQSRGEYYGAKNYAIGENVAFTLVNTKMESKSRKEYYNRTYEDIAFDLVDAWVHSPPHYKNIIDSNYQVTGVSIAFDPITKKVYATQKFAKINFKYTFQENKQFFNYSNYQPAYSPSSFEGISTERHSGRHVWNLKTPEDSASFCSSCNEAVDSSLYLSEILLKGNRIIFYSPDIEMMKKLIRKRKDGLAVEIVEYKKEDCGNPEYYTYPSRRNNQCIFSGTVLKPVYKKKLKRAFKPHTKRGLLKQKYDYSKSQRFEVSLGRLDKKKFEGLIEFNLVIIKKGKVCRIRRFSDVCGDSIREIFPMPFLMDKFENLYSIPDNIRKLQFEIPFEKGKSEFSDKDIQPITDSLILTPFIIDSLEIHAYSSIEGNEELNKRLQQARANSLAKALLNKQSEKVNYLITAEENWKLFEEQIKQTRSLNKFKDLDKQKTKEIISNPEESQKIEPLLKQQRKAIVTMKIRETHPDSILENYIPIKFKFIEKELFKDLAKNGSSIKTKMYLDTLKGLLTLSYAKWKEGIISSEIFDKLEIPFDDAFANMHHMQFMFRIEAGIIKKDDHNRILHDTKEIFNKNYSNYTLLYLNLRSALYKAEEKGKKFKITNPYDLPGNLNKLKKQAPNEYLSALCDTLEWNYLHLATSNKIEAIPENALDQLYVEMVERDLSDSMRTKYAELFISYKRYDYAYYMIAPAIDSTQKYRPLLSLYTKLLYEHFEESRNSNYLNWLLYLKNFYPETEWCELFTGPCNISFQLLDHEEFRAIFCETCKGKPYYAVTPEKWD